MKYPAGLMAVAFTAVAIPAMAQSALLADLHGLSPRQLRSQAFTLAAAQDVRIEAVGEPGDSDGSFTVLGIAWNGGRNDGRRQPWSGNAWIIDLRTRRTVWELSAAETSRGTRETRQFNGTVRLAAGSYAAYLAAYPPVAFTSDDSSTANRLWRYFTESVDDYKMTVRGSGQPLAAAEVDRLRNEAFANPIVQFRGKSPQQYQQTGFILDRPTEVEVYAVGEARDDAEFDSGWIINADTREKVWKLTWNDSSAAGGAEKNRVARATRRLPAGRYAAFYATDDSHDQSEWNSPPPHDPDSWGMTIRTTSADARAAVKTFPYEHVSAAAAFVSLTGIGDGESRRSGFTLKRAMDVRIYAIGEGREGRMFDYGWITGEGRKRVWEMRQDATEHAGGDAKNRLVDRTIRLEPGNYVVHYVSDSSHSAREWNAAAPADSKRWGISLLAASGSLDRGAIAAYDPASDPAVIAQLTGVRDDDRLQKRFTLDRDASVRVVALGEGSGRQLVDYGWIEDAKTGRTVWEMTYRMTGHAGGAEKNRRFEGTVQLPAGEYILKYSTDDSHAFGDWNADPPDEPEAWGITVYRAR